MKFGSPCLGEAQRPQEQPYPFLSVCGVFSCVHTMAWLPVFGIFDTLTDEMMMHAVAHAGCSDTERESALEVDSGRKMLCCTGGSNPFQHCAWLFSRTLYQWSYAPTWVIIKACQEKIMCSLVHFLLLAQVVHHWSIACCALLSVCGEVAS